MAFAIGASTSGFAGILYGEQDQLRRPAATSPCSCRSSCSSSSSSAAWGPCPARWSGAAFLQWVPQYPAPCIPLFGYQPQDLYIYLGALLVVMMIFRPEGISRPAGGGGRSGSPRAASAPPTP